MDQSHSIRFYSIEGESPSLEVDVDAQPPERVGCEQRFRVTVPGCELLSVPVEAPGEIVSRNAAVTIFPFPVNAFAGQANIGACSRDRYLKIVPVQIQALLGEHLSPVHKTTGELWVRMLPW